MVDEWWGWLWLDSFDGVGAVLAPVHHCALPRPKLGDIGLASYHLS